MNEPATTPAARETVGVRMHRGILGDFFTLTHRIGERSFRALVDCGALQCIGAHGAKPETQASLDRLAVAIDSMLDEGTHFDLVIATHEHYDHLGGFMKYYSKFADRGFSIGKLWLAWTEDENDQLAKDIRAGRSKGLDALNALVANDDAAQAFGIGEADKIAQSRIANLRNLLQFNGELDPEAAERFAARTKADAHALAGGQVPAEAPRIARVPPRSCRDAFDWLKQIAGADNVSYLLPGQLIRFGLDDRLTASVLGPPRTRARLLKMNPVDDGDAYLVDGDPYGALTARLEANMIAQKTRSEARAAAAADAAENGATLADDVEVFAPVDTARPFDSRYDNWPEWKLAWKKDKKPRDAASDEPPADAPKGSVYVVSKCPVARLYFDPEVANRRIDGDWLQSAEALALKIDGDVNNTSLALAIETPDSKVLLFPADAQVGNWLSWHDQDYPSEPGIQSGKGESAKTLLSRVVLYKVGHHGSHNATSKALGLELMTHPGLAAMIPVVEEVAKEQRTKSNPDGWEMPFGDLYSRLKVKTSERILRGDGKLAEEQAAFAGSIFDLSYDPSNPTDPLWVELNLAV